MSEEKITTEFLHELASVINRHSVDTQVCMPDFIIAEYVGYCLKGLTAANWNFAAWQGKSIPWTPFTADAEGKEEG